MDGTRLFTILFLLCFFVFQLVTARSTLICTGKWARHACGGGNGRRAEIEELLGYEKKSTPDDDSLPSGYVSDLGYRGEASRDSDDYAASKDSSSSSSSSDPYLTAPYEAKVRSDEREKDRRLNALITRILLKKQQLLDD